MAASGNVPDTNPRVAPEKRPSVSSATFSPSAAVDQRVTPSISRMPARARPRGGSPARCRRVGAAANGGAIVFRIEHARDTSNVRLQPDLE